MPPKCPFADFSSVGSDPDRWITWGQNTAALSNIYAPLIALMYCAYLERVKRLCQEEMFKSLSFGNRSNVEPIAGDDLSRCSLLEAGKPVATKASSSFRFNAADTKETL